jgi:hypothetical protein
MVFLWKIFLMKFQALEIVNYFRNEAKIENLEQSIELKCNYLHFDFQVVGFCKTDWRFDVSTKKTLFSDFRYLKRISRDFRTFCLNTLFLMSSDHQKIFFIESGNRNRKLHQFKDESAFRDKSKKKRNCLIASNYL